MEIIIISIIIFVSLLYMIRKAIRSTTGKDQCSHGCGSCPAGGGTCKSEGSEQ